MSINVFMGDKIRSDHEPTGGNSASGDSTREDSACKDFKRDDSISDASKCEDSIRDDSKSYDGKMDVVVIDMVVVNVDIGLVIPPVVIVENVEAMVGGQMEDSNKNQLKGLTFLNSKNKQKNSRNV